MSVTAAENQLHRDIGRLEAKLDGLTALVQAAEVTARESRAGVYRRLDDLSQSVAVMKEKHEGLEKRVEKIAPFAEKASKWEQRGIGAVAAVGMMSGGIGAALVYFKDKVAALFTG